MFKVTWEQAEELGSKLKTFYLQKLGSVLSADCDPQLLMSPILKDFS